MTGRKVLGEVGGTFLRAWRTHAGMNQAEAAEKIGIDRTGLSRIETGAVGYSRSFLESAAGVYGCSPGDLISRPPLSMTGEGGGSTLAAALSKIIESTVAAIVEVYGIPIGRAECTALAGMIAADFAEHEFRAGLDPESALGIDRLEYSIVRFLLRLSREAGHQ